jgi:adenylate kinase
LNQAAQQKVFIFIGAPGSGKGTLAYWCTKRFGWQQVSTGNLCRKQIAEETEIGKEIDLIIKSGKLIDDDLITSMVFQWLQDHKSHLSGVIFDGYPRTVKQAHDFEKILADLFPEVRPSVVSFVISDEAIVQRLSNRLVCSNKQCQAVYSCGANNISLGMPCKECGSRLERRADDSEEAVKKRLTIYHKHEKELLGFYKASNTVDICELFVERPIADVFECFVQYTSTH